MAVITKTIQPGEKSAEVTEIQKALISLGANIAPGELFTATTAGTFGPTTQAAITALLLRFGFSQGGQQPHFNPHVGRLLNIAVGAELGSSTALKKAVRESFDARQAAPVAGPPELAVLARYAVIGLDFTTARKIAAQIPNEPVIKEKVGPIVNGTTLQPPAPELVNRENYYTFAYNYASRSEVQELFPGT